MGAFKLRLATAALCVACGVSATANSTGRGDEGGDEIIVTAQMRTSGRDARTPIVEEALPAAVQRLQRRADFAVLQVLVISDTETTQVAAKEVHAMVGKALDLSKSLGVELSSGEAVVEPVTRTNYASLEIKAIEIEREYPDDDLDGQGAWIWVKVPLASGIDGRAVRARIDAFVKKVPAVGRAQMVVMGELNLSVVNPEQYRGAIIDLVVKDNLATRAKFGSDVGVRVTGLDRPVKWLRTGLTDVQLYLPTTSTIGGSN